MTVRHRRGWVLGAVAAAVGALVALAGAGVDDGEVPIPSTTLPPATTTTVGPWEAAGFADLPAVHSDLVVVGAQLVAYHTVEPDGSVHVVVADMAEARVNWRREVELPDRNRGLALPPPAFQVDQNLIHVVIDESRRAPDAPLPGEEPAEATPTPTRDPDAEPELAVVGLDASDGFGITDVPFDLVPRDLPAMCDDVVCFPAADLDGSAVLALVDPATGSVRVGTEGFATVVASDGADAITIRDDAANEYAGEIVATTAWRGSVAWTSTVDALFDGADVSPVRGWAGMRTVDGSWVLWLSGRAEGDPPTGDAFVALGPGEVLDGGAVAIIGGGGEPGPVVEGSLCRGLRTDVAVRAVAVCEGDLVVAADGSRTRPSAVIRIVDASGGTVLAELATTGYLDAADSPRVSLVDAGAFVVDTDDGVFRVDLAVGTVEEMRSRPAVAWCVGADDGSGGVPVLDADGLRVAHRVADPVYPCTPTLGELPAAAVGERLRSGELDARSVGFVRTAEWVAWVGGDRGLRAVRLG